jgi:hypothetical protein
MATCLLSCYGLFMKIHSCFVSLGMLIVHNYLNTCLYALWNTLILIFVHNISFFSQFVFDVFIAKGGELILGGVLSLSFCFEFERLLLFWAFLSSSVPFCLALPLFLPFVGFYGCPSSRWPSWAFFGFLGLLAVLYGVLNSNFKLCAFIVNELIKGKIEKPSGQFLGLIVMSHWLGEVWSRIQDSFILFFFYLCLIRRITFAYLVMCRW